jgi:hypothetical protein
VRKAEKAAQTQSTRINRISTKSQTLMQNKDCLSCRLVGFSAFTILGAWTWKQSKYSLKSNRLPLRFLSVAFAAVGFGRLID